MGYDDLILHLYSNVNSLKILQLKSKNISFGYMFHIAKKFHTLVVITASLTSAR